MFFFLGITGIKNTRPVKTERVFLPEYLHLSILFYSIHRHNIYKTR